MNSSIKETSGTGRTAGQMFGTLSFGYLLMILLIAVPVFMAGVWKIIANTRLLDLLMSSGIIAYTDLDLGFIRGVPDLGDYLKSQDAIDERLVFMVFAIYLLFYFLKAIKFHVIGRLYGLKGSFGNHTRAFYYGTGINILMPFRAGDIALVSALEGQGEKPERVTSTLYVQDMFVCWEIAFFFLLGLFLTGWQMTFRQTLPAVIFTAVLSFIVGSARGKSAFAGKTGSRQISFRILKVLFNKPALVIQLGLLAIFVFFLDDVTPYLISQAFTNEYVHLNVPFLILQAGVVAGYIASRVPITPGCIGQFEFGFGTALLFGGIALPEAITIVILEGLVRHSTALLLFVGVKVFYGVETEFRTVLKRFRGDIDDIPVPAQAGGEK